MAEQETKDMSYIIHQSDSLLRQWEFYENLTWRIPTMVVSVNAGILLALRFIERSFIEDIESALFLFIGLITWLYGYRLYRASKLAQKLLNEIHTKFDNVYGLKGVIRRTKHIRRWPWWAQESSRLISARIFLLWGLVYIVLGSLCVALDISVLCG